MTMEAIALWQLGVGAVSAISNGIFSGISNNNQRKQLNESLRSNYYSYMDQLASMQGQLADTQTALNANIENIATNRNYLDRWASEYDLTMNSAVDETFGQYQQIAGNLGMGNVGLGESGRSGGSAGLLNAGTANTLKTYNNGSLGGLDMDGRLSAYLRSTSLDMLADRQTALSSVENGYKAIPTYQEAIQELNTAIYGDKDKGTYGMLATTADMKKQLKKEGLKV